MAVEMRQWLVLCVVAGGLSVAASNVHAAEHGGHEHGGQEHGGATTAAAPTPAAPSAEHIRQTIRDYVAALTSAHGGAMKINDTVTGQTRSLTLDRVHERVGKTGDKYYSCTDMTDTATGDKVDVDFDVADDGGHLSVVETRIHKVNGKARYTYDANDHRLPL